MGRPSEETKKFIMAQPPNTLEPIGLDSITRNDDYPQSMEAQEPMPFPDAKVDPCIRINTRIYNPFTLDATRQYFIVSDCVLVPQSTNPALTSDVAYWLKKELKIAQFGRVWAAAVLNRRMACVPSSQSNPLNPWAEWELTLEEVVVKEMSWSRIKQCHTTHVENPLREVAAMQYIKHVHERRLFPDKYVDSNATSCSSMEAFLQVKYLMKRTGLIMILVVLSDDNYLYSVMPICKGGGLLDYCDHRVPFTEGECRYWMHKILLGIESLQAAGVCHRDINLENIVIDSTGSSIVIDLGMALRIPYDSNPSIVERGCEKGRSLIKRQSICGKLYYISPEILENKDCFDGHAVDLWAVGVLLYMMLVGNPPWKRASVTDLSFDYISNGNLENLLRKWGKSLSVDAMDLLQGMLFVNAQDRFSLKQIKAHRWMQGPVESPILQEHRQVG